MSFSFYHYGFFLAFFMGHLPHSRLPPPTPAALSVQFASVSSNFFVIYVWLFFVHFLS